MKTMFAKCLIPMSLALPALAAAADPDVFSGIYSVTDPVTGIEVDVLKIRQYSDGYGVFFYLSGEAPRGSLRATESAATVRIPPAFPTDPNVRTLSVPDVGSLYYAPGGVYSPVGRSDTGYMSQMDGLDMYALKRRPLPKARERGVNGIHAYTPSADEGEVSVRALNYSPSAFQLGISSAANSKNAVDTDPLNPYMAGALNCCFYLPGKWSPSLQVNIELLAPDGKLKTVPVAVPRYESPQDLDVAVHRDGRVEILFLRDSVTQPLPKPPAAESTAAKAAEWKRRQLFLDDLSKRLPELPEDVQRSYREEIASRTSALRDAKLGK